MRNTEEIALRRKNVLLARNAPFWAYVNGAVLIVLLMELRCRILPSLFLGQNVLTQCAEFSENILSTLFSMNAIYNIYLCYWFKHKMQPIQLSEKEYQLFGIGQHEAGFERQTDAMQPSKNDKNAMLSSNMPKFEFNNSCSFMGHTSLDSTALSSRLCDTSLNSTNASWSFHNASFKDNSFRNHSFNNSGADLKFRKSNSFALSTRKSTPIRSDEELKSFLQAYEERSEQVNELLQSHKRFSTSAVDGNGTPNVSNNLSFNHSANTSFHNPQNSSLNTSNISQTDGANNSLSNLFSSYKPAIKVVSGVKSLDKDEAVDYTSGHHHSRHLEKINKLLNTNDVSLNQMVENIRGWISQTILTRLAEQIDTINREITQKGYIEGLIGETPIQQLKTFSESKMAEFPSLHQIYLFFHIPSKTMENTVALQQYLVKRVKDLAKGGCISEYIWNGGGTYNYKPWKEELPTDAEIILHLFSVYLDSRILFNPAIPEGRPFSSQYLKTPTLKTPKADTFIEQTTVGAPHYSVVLKGEKYDMPPGRNNLFYAILVFINHIQTKNFGLLGRINLGSSGLNIAWVINNALKENN